MPDRPSVPQGNQCLLSHFLASLRAQEETNCTSMLWSIDSCQNRVSADQHHLTVPRGRVFLKLSADKLPVSNNRRLKFIFSNDSYEICCVYVTMALHCQDFDFKLTSDAKIQPVFLKNTGGEDLFLPWSPVGHPLRPIFILDWSKIDRWVHEENLCSILKVVYFEGWSWQGFTCVNLWCI